MDPCHTARRRLRCLAQAVHSRQVARVGREAITDPTWRPSSQCHVPAEAIVKAVVEGGEGLTPAHCEFFSAQGFLVLPALVPPTLCEGIKREMDGHMALRADPSGPRPPLFVSYRHIGGLTSFPPTIKCVQLLMGGRRFSMHHVHGSRMDAGAAQSPWHQDYERYPQTDREHTMVHAFNYIDGLAGVAWLDIPLASARSAVPIHPVVTCCSLLWLSRRSRRPAAAPSLTPCTPQSERFQQIVRDCTTARARGPG